MAQSGGVRIIEASPVDPDAFGYVCRQCSRCCYHKMIQVNPYEVSRLAKAAGVSGPELRARFTLAGRGEYLAQKEDGSCVFLAQGGCTVHEGRPLVCRLYPLGRTISADGSVVYTLLAGHPETAGTLTGNGTVAAYVEAQGALPFIAAADAYFRWFCDAAGRGALVSGGPADLDVSADVLDLDAAVERHCAETGTTLPVEADERLSLHLDLLYELLEDALERPGQPEERSSV